MGRVNRDGVYASFPAERPGAGWALLKCAIGDDGITEHCEVVDESDPGSKFGIWAQRVQERAVVIVGEGGAVTGDSYLTISRWAVL